MSAFSSFTGGKSKTVPARRVELLPFSAFADTYKQRPSGPAKIGLRLVSETELATAQSDAARTAWDMHPDASDVELRIEVLNDNIITNVLARVCCQADNVNEPFFAPDPEMRIRVALAPGGIRHLWSKYQLMAIGDGALSDEASDDDLRSLGSAITAGINALDAASQARVRKLARAMLDELVTTSKGAP